MKNLEAKVKIYLRAQEANPSPPIGPILGSKGVNIMKFCNEFNLSSKNILKGTLVSVLINIYSDKSFDFIIKSTPTSVLLKEIVKIDKGSSLPNKTIVAEIKKIDLDYIFEKKKFDMIFSSKEKAIKSIIGTAKSMGIKVLDD